MHTVTAYFKGGFSTRNYVESITTDEEDVAHDWFSERRGKAHLRLMVMTFNGKYMAHYAPDATPAE